MTRPANSIQHPLPQAPLGLWRWEFPSRVSFHNLADHGDTLVADMRLGPRHPPSFLQPPASSLA